MRHLWFTLIMFFLFVKGYATVMTNVGTDFWIAFPPNYTLSATLQIFISSEFATSGTVTSSFPGVDQSFTVTPGIVTQLSVPGGVGLFGGIENKGIRITSADPVAVYGLSWMTASTDAYMALPVSSLGTDYMVLSYETTLSGLGSALSVVATHDGTVLTIFNNQTNNTYIINLDEGQTYYEEVSAIGEDFTGSTVQSNYPVAVFGSVEATDIPAGCMFADHVVEQLFPLSAWAMNFVTVPLAGRDNSGDIFRVLASADNTDVAINGTIVATLNKGQYYESNLTGYNSIVASNPVLLGQYAKSTNCAGGLTGDPFFMLIFPREQFIPNYTIATLAGFTSHWANIVAPAQALGTIYQDGILIPISAFVQIGTTSFYGAQRSLTEGSHTFTSNSPFGVFVYGWTNVNSYGYPGGGSLSPVGTVASVTISPDSASGILDVTTVCFTAHVEDDFNNPVEGVLVNFMISGCSNLVGNAYTDASGNAQYCYMQSGTVSCIDNVYAEIFGFTSSTSIVNWTYLAPCTNPTDGGTVGNDQTGCGAFTPAMLTGIVAPTGYSGTLEYKWQVSLTDAITGFVDLPGSNSSAYAPGTVTQTSWYRRLSRVDCMPDWTGAAVSNAVMLTVLPVMPVSVTISEDTNMVCQGTPVTFTANPVNGGSNPSYQWQVNGINVGTNSPVFTYIPASLDLVSCIMTSNLACVSNNPASSIQHQVYVNPLPVVTFTPCFDTITTNGAKPIRLRGGMPTGGTYTGPGVSGGYFYPNLAGAGTHVITYTYVNAALCSNSTNSRIHVSTNPIFSCGNNWIDIRDGKSYPTVQTGGQCWFAADLNFGIEIPPNIHQRDNCINEKYFNPASSIQHPASVYQWDELMKFDPTPGNQGLCPPTWHVPTEAEWAILFSNWTNSAFAASALKYSGYSGFDAFLSGARHETVQWDFQNFAAFFWSSTAHGPFKAWAHGMNNPDPSVSYYPSLRSNAFSVRCLRD